MCNTCLRATLRTNAAATGAEHGACPICRNAVDDGEGSKGVLSLRSLVASLQSNREENLGSDSDEDDDAAAKAAMARVLARAAAAGTRVGRGGAAAGKRLEGDDGDDGDGIANSAKITAVLDEIAAIRDAAPAGEQPEQTVIFSQFTSFLDLVGPKIRAAGHETLRLDGTQALPTRAKVVQAFRRGEAAVLLVSLKAASLGLNLNCASRVILVDPWWNAAIEDQAIDRCHRIGQTREVKVVRMLVKDTTEARIMELQEKKRNIATAALGDGADSLNAMRQQLSLRDLQNLFGRRRVGGGAGAREDDSMRCRCQPGRCLNCMCVTFNTKCTPACNCGGQCANGNDEGAVGPGAGAGQVGPFGRAPPPPRAKPEPRQ
jgi:superfamily II DNA or RNA helicase